MEIVSIVKDFFLRGEGNAIGRRARDTGSPLIAAMSDEFYDGMTCWYDHGFNQFDCEGVQCTYGGQSMLVDAAADDSASTTTGAHFNALYDPSGQYTCDNGCTLWADGMGGVGFHCPEDEGGDEGGGAGGAPPPAVSLCDMPTNWNNNVDTLMICDRDRSASEDSLIALARTNHLRTNFAGDSQAQQICQEMNTWLTTALAETNPQTGKQTFSTGVDNSGITPHWGQAMSGVGHVDPRTYQNVRNNPTSVVAWRRLLSTLLHEAAHGWGYKEHPNQFDSQGRYSDEYFKRLFPNTLEAGTCLK